VDFLSGLRQEHEILQVMAAIFKELIKRLSKAKAVNLRDLEDVYSLWVEYLVSHHLFIEEDHLFTELRKAGHQLCAELVQAHTEIRNHLHQIGEVINRLRKGRPNSGRDLVKTGENLVWLIESHMRDEDRILDDLVAQEGDGFQASYEDLFFSGPPRKKVTALGLSLSSKLKRLSLEYLGKELNLPWLDQTEDNTIFEEKRLQKGEDIHIQGQEHLELEINAETKQREKETVGSEEGTEREKGGDISIGIEQEEGESESQVKETL